MIAGVDDREGLVAVVALEHRVQVPGSARREGVHGQEIVYEIEAMLSALPQASPALLVEGREEGPLSAVRHRQVGRLQSLRLRGLLLRADRVVGAVPVPAVLALVPGPRVVLALALALTLVLVKVAGAEPGVGARERRVGRSW